MTFEEILKYKGDITLVAYIDFETTAPTEQCRDPQNRKMFAVSCVIIFAFHPDLHIDRVIIERSFRHSLKIPVGLSYLTRKQHKFKDKKTMMHLKDCAPAVHARNSKIAISEMFTTESNITADFLLKCFNVKFKSTNLEWSNSAKRKHEITKVRKYEILLIGRVTVGVFAHSLSKQMLPNLMLIAKFYHFQRARFSETYFRARVRHER